MKKFFQINMYFALLIGLIYLLPVNCFAQWSSDAHANTIICVSPNSQEQSVMVSDGAGGAIIAWHDNRNDIGDIYAQHIDANGVILWEANGISISSAAGAQLRPSIISDENGGAIITWADFRDIIDPNNPEVNVNIYAQRVNGSGVVQWTAEGIAVSTAPGEQTLPILASDGNGGAFITWKDYRGRSQQNTDIYMQCVNANGTLKGPELEVCTSLENQVNPAIISDGNGGAFITWLDTRNATNGTSGSDIFAQRIGINGLATWTKDGVPVCEASGSQDQFSLTSDGAGGAIIVWYDTRDIAGTGSNIYAQRFNANGIGQWATNGIGISTALGNQTYPIITTDQEGGAMIGWETVTNFTVTLSLQRISGAGAKLWVNDGLIVSYKEKPGSPTITSDGDGGVLLVWENTANFGDHMPTFGQHVDAGGNELWPFEGVSIRYGYPIHEAHHVVSDGQGGAIVAWDDGRNILNDIYAQRIQADGVLGGGNVVGNQTITFNPIPEQKFSQSIFTLGAIASSGLPVTYTSSDPSVATIDRTFLTIIGAGTSMITATQAGNANFTAALPVSRLFTVIKGDQFIRFDELPSKTPGDAPFTLSATASSDLTVSYTSSNAAVATVSGNTVTIIGAGTTNITASQAGNVNYNAAPNVFQPLEVKSNQSISFSALPSKTSGDPAFTLTASASSGLAVSYTSSNPAVASVTGNTVTIIGVGSTHITASQAGNGTYAAAANVVQTLIVKSTQSIVFPQISVKTFSDGSFTLGATASSGLSVTYTSSDLSVATIAGTTVTIKGVGASIITASQEGNTNFNEAPSITQQLIVNKGSQFITFNSLPSKTNGDAPFILSATASSGLAVAYASSNTAVATVSGNTVTILGVGSTTITTSQPGDANYSPAANVSQLLTVKATQSISFSAILDKTFGDPDFTLSATSSAGLPVIFSSSSDKITINGSQVVIIKAGAVTIHADQAGNTNFTSAHQVAQTFCINPAKPSITITGLGTETPLLTSGSAFGNQWFKNTVAIQGATNPTFAPTTEGVFTVVVSVDNCASVPADEKVLIITGVETQRTEVNVYPNPMENKLVVDVTAFGSTEPVSLAMYDVLGHVLFTTTGNGTININVGAYQAGTYLLRIQSDKEVIIKKLKK